MSTLKSMKEAKGIMLIFDLTQKQSFYDLDIWLDIIRENLRNPFIILIGNKSDMEKDERKVISEEVNKFA